MAPDGPSAWRGRPLGSLIREDKPICYGVLKPGPFDPGGVPLVRIVDMGGEVVRQSALFRITPWLDKEFARSRLEGGELLLSIQGTIGRVAIVPQDLRGANISRTIARISFGPEAEATFFRQWLLSERGQKLLLDTIVGTTRASLNIGDIRLLELPVPPLSEQRQIGAILDTIDDAIRKTEQIIGKLKQVKQGLLHDLLTRGIDDNGELRDPERHPKQFKNSPVGRVPREWEVIALGECLNLRPRNGLYKPPSEFVEDGVCLLDIAALYRGVFAETKATRRVRVSRSELRTYEVLSGDLLMNRVSVKPDGVGLAAVATGLTEPFVYESNMFRLRPNHARLVPLFLAHLLRSPILRSAILARALTVAQTSINQQVVNTLPIVVPHFEEQEAISIRLVFSHERIRAERRGLEKLRLLKSGLMEDLLTGRVRVTKLLESAAE